MTEAQKQNLERQLWNIANELRGKMDADQFRDYILGFIFYKYLSEKQYIFANRLLETEKLKDYQLVTDADDLEAIREESIEKLGYFLKPQELFSAIAARGNVKIDEDDEETAGNFILEDLQGILNAIEQSTMGSESEDDFNKLFADIDLAAGRLGRTPGARNTLIAKVLAHLDKIDFQLDQVDADVLGDAYEYLIAQFASGAGKKAGEFYTPQQVSKVLAKIVTLGKSKVKSAYDPACGSGSLLLRIAKEAEVGEFFGQELNATTYNLARMNMILHDVHFSRFDIQQEDTLEEPQHMDQKFEAVVANPPFSAKWKGSENPLNETDDRFSQYGVLPPKSKADFAFVAHMIYHMADNGVSAVVLPHGVLYRDRAEKSIREYIIREKNYLDAVIGLPVNLFYGTGIPACILVFKKCRYNDNDILFIDASQEFDRISNQNLLNNDHVEKIVEAYRERKDVEKYAHVATLSEIVENDYNLNIPRYVNMFDPEKRVKLNDVAVSLDTLETKREEKIKEVSKFCEKLDIPKPNGSNPLYLQQFKKGCMQVLFFQEARFRDDSGQPFPDWKEIKLAQAFSERSERGDPNGELLSVTMSRGVVRARDVNRATSASEDRSNYKTVYPGDIAYNSMRMWQGASGVSKHKGIVSPAYTVICPNDDQMPSFWGYYFKLETNIQIFQRFSQGLTSDTWNLKFPTLSSIKMTVPDFSEQTKIAEFLSVIDDLIETVS